MEEMRQMIQNRMGRPVSASYPSESTSSSPGGVNDEAVARLESLAGEADKFLQRASTHQVDIELEISDLQAQYHEVRKFSYVKKITELVLVGNCKVGSLGRRCRSREETMRSR